MGRLSSYTEGKLLRHVLKISSYSSPTNISLGLSLTIPHENGSGIFEPSGGGYSRVTAMNWSSATDKRIHNTSVIEFPSPTVEWGLIRSVFAVDESDNLLWYGVLNVPKSINVGNILSFPAGEIVFLFEPGGITTYLANKLLNHLFAKETYPQPSVLYLALSTKEISDVSNFPSEPSGGGYNRVSAGSFTESNGVASNNETIQFPVATSNWGAIQAICICDDEDGGNVLFYKNLTELIVQTGDTIKIPSGDLTITLD